MVRDINGLGGHPGTNTRVSNSTGKAPEHSNAGGSKAAENTAPQQDEVALSNRAQTLQALESKLQDLPGVDTARVDAIKHALEQGNFKIDDLVVADKLINSDTLLGE
jgi:negative regulator of flagellin synthesis FlgM